MDLSVPDIIIRLLAGLFIGFAIGLTGIGGGVLVMPALTMLLKIPTVAAVGTASLYALLVKSYAVFEHYKLKTIELTISLFFLAGAIPGNIITAVLINRYMVANQENTAKISAFQDHLKTFIACVLLLAVLLLVFQLIRGKKKAPATKDSEAEDGPDIAPNIPGKQTRGKMVLGILLGVFVGALIGSTSVGGGVIIIPLLIICFGLPTERTVGTSIFIAVVLTLCTTIIYGEGGEIRYLTAVIMAAGSLAGVYFGSRLSVKMPEKVLKAIVTALILIATVLMFIGKSAH